MRRRKKIDENKICVYTKVRHFSCISLIDARTSVFINNRYAGNSWAERKS